MFKTNYHSHSKFSDGTGTLADYLKFAIENNFDAIGFSEHAPLPMENDWAIPKMELKTYIDELTGLKQVYKEKLDVKIGLEIDYIENLISPADPFYSDIGLDFTIGSVHLLKDSTTGEYLGIDYKKSEIEQLINKTFRGDAQLLVKEYYSKIRDMSDRGGFDIIGHLDVIKKTNINSIYFDETEDWYKKEIDVTLECIAANKQIVEINTGNILKDPSRIYPSPWILKLAKDYDIPIMLNSDAHRPDRLDNYFKEAKIMALNVGYSEFKVFIDDKWINDKIV